MSDEVNISSTGKRVSGARAEEQSKRLADVEDRQAADRAAALRAQEEQRKAVEKAEEERRASEEDAVKAAAEAEAAAEAQREALEKIGAAALSVGGTVVGSAAESVKKGQLKVSPKTAFFAIAAIAIVALLLFIAWPRLSSILFPQPQPTQAVQLEESSAAGIAALHNTSAEIGQAILGEARQRQELVVWEQDVQVDSRISQALANLAVFSKTKNVRSFGTGVFTVDMGSIDEGAIQVDEQARTVTMRIPHTQLQYITKDLEKTEFEDTEHAIFGFGDVKLTQEQQNLLERSIEDAMRAELESDECFADADAAALLVVYDVYQPLVVQIDDTYTLEVVFA